MCQTLFYGIIFFFTRKIKQTKNSRHSGSWPVCITNTTQDQYDASYSFISFSLSQGQAEGNQTNKTETKQTENPAFQEASLAKK